MSTAHAVMPALLRLRGRLVPESAGLGWVPFYHLGYLAFLFLPMVLALFGQDGPWLGPTGRILWPTLLSVPAFLLLYFAAYRSEGAVRDACMVAIALLACVVLPFNAFANTYTIYACGFAAKRGRSVWTSLGWMALSLGLLLAGVLWVRYPVFIFFITLIVAVAVFFANHHFLEITRKRAELLLSHEEVRRLAQTAERERIGRDLHDLLGHTLSLVALKSDLAAKLVEREPQAALREIDEVRRVAREALAQVRGAVTGMRAAALAAELASARLLLECDGVRFDVRLDGVGLQAHALPTELETALALTLREATTNIQRHARATSAHARFGVRAQRCRRPSSKSATTAAAARSPRATACAGCASASRRSAARCASTACPGRARGSKCGCRWRWRREPGAQVGDGARAPRSPASRVRSRYPFAPLARSDPLPVLPLCPYDRVAHTAARSCQLPVVVPNAAKDLLFRSSTWNNIGFVVRIGFKAGPSLRSGRQGIGDRIVASDETSGRHSRESGNPTSTAAVKEPLINSEVPRAMDGALAHRSRKRSMWRERTQAWPESATSGRLQDGVVQTFLDWVPACAGMTG